MSLIDLTITINGQTPELDFDQLLIHQKFDSHHTFELSYMLPPRTKFDVKELEELLGEMMEVSFKNKDASEDQLFLGIIDNASSYFTAGRLHLRLEGFGPSILMDNTPRFRSYEEEDVGGLIQDVLREYDLDLESRDSKQVSYVVQNQESDYHFICRLADEAGLVIHYDGEKFILSEFKDGSSSIQLGLSELDGLEAQLNLAQTEFSVRGHNYKEDKLETYNSPNRSGSKSNDSAVQAALNKSSVYPQGMVGVIPSFSEENLTEQAEVQYASRETNRLFTLQAGSDRADIKIGSQVSIEQKDHENLPGVDGNTQFTITHLSHYFSNNKQYKNFFKAVPSDHPFPLNMLGANLGTAMGSIVAEVTENEDPDQLGRVRVKYLVDENDTQSPWIKVMNVYSANGGSFFVPAVGERVMVFYEGGQLEKAPFVMGGFFNGRDKADQWSVEEKGFRMENMSMVFNEKEGSISFKAKTIFLEAEEEIKLSNANSIQLEAKDKLEMVSDNSLNLEARNELAAKGNQVSTEAMTELKLSGGSMIKQQAPMIHLN